MTESRVTMTLQDHVADVRLARPDKMNALDAPMFDAIVRTIDELARTEGVRAVVLSGEGKAFCAGLDMASMMVGGVDVSTLDERTHGLANLYQQVAWGWRQLGVPVIAAAHGVVFGGGLQIFSGADVKLVAPGTRLSVMEMKWGLVPDMAGIALWRTTVRDDVLRELTYTAREFSAEEAVSFGFATRLAGDPREEALALARSIALRSPQAIRAAKRLLNVQADASAKEILQAESDEQQKLIMQPNQLEAVAANMQKRAPVFTDG